MRANSSTGRAKNPGRWDNILRVDRLRTLFYRKGPCKHSRILLRSLDGVNILSRRRWNDLFHLKDWALGLGSLDYGAKRGAKRESKGTEGWIIRQIGVLAFQQARL